MTAAQHPLASHHLPFFITAPGETDTLMVVMLFLLIAIVLMIGNFYFQLHALPERMGHHRSTNHVQMQIVAVLTLLALFTHNHMFWIAALLLALIQLPDFSSPINSMAESLKALAGSRATPLEPEPDMAPPRMVVEASTPIGPLPSANDGAIRAIDDRNGERFEEKGAQHA